MSEKNVGPLAETRLSLRVSYRDTDRMGHVYYANYLVYFEMARGQLIRELGRSYAEVEERLGIFLPVVEAQCRYRAAARYDELIEVHARVTRWTRAAMDFAYELRRPADDALLAEGVTRHVFMDREGRICRRGHEILPGPGGTLT